MCALHCKYPDYALLHRISNWIHGIVCHPLALLQTNESAAQSNAFASEIANLAAMTAYKCQLNRMDSMSHARDSVPMVYFCKLDPMVDNEDYRLKFQKKEQTNQNRPLVHSIQMEFRWNYYFDWMNILCQWTVDKKLYLNSTCMALEFTTQHKKWIRRKCKMKFSEFRNLMKVSTSFVTSKCSCLNMERCGLTCKEFTYISNYKTTGTM